MNTHILLLSLPALYADAATLMQCVAELSETYTALLQSEHLVEEPLQYVDVSAWQDDLLQEKDAEQRCQYWSRIDLSRLTSMRLPLERERSIEDCEAEMGQKEVFLP